MSTKRWVTAAVAGAALAAPAGMAMAAPTPAPVAIRGSGTVAATQYSISVNAGPFGEDPTGTLSLNGFFSFDATASCVNEGGQDGVAGFRIDTGPLAGMGFLSASQASNGIGDGAILYSGILPTAPTACPPPGTPPPALTGQGGGGTVQGTLGHTGGPDHPVPFQQLSFPTPAAPGAIAQAVDGSLWFAEPHAGKIATAPDDESGQITEYTVPPAGPVSSVAPDSAGGVWLAEPDTSSVARVDPTGQVTTYPVPGGASATSIAEAPDGGAWFTEPDRSAIAHIDTSGRVTLTTLPNARANLGAIAPTGDGGVWFTEPSASRVGVITQRGAVHEFATPTSFSRPTLIAGDGQGGAWFFEAGAGQFGHLDPTGVGAEYPLPSDVSSVGSLAAGPDPDGSPGVAWFSDPTDSRIGFLSPGGAVDEFTLPGANPGALAVAPSLNAAPLTGYDDSEAVWWTDAVNGRVGLARFPLGTSGSPTTTTSAYGAVSVAAPRSVTVRRSVISLTVRCAGLVSCSGDATLRHQVRRPHPPPVLATRRFRIGAGRSAVLRLALNGRGRGLVAAARRAGLSTGLTVRWSSYGHQLVRLMTLHPARRRRRG